MKSFLIACILLWSCSEGLSMDTVIVAHRGASKDAPENTIPAFELAWKQGADAIEGDFYLTKDGEIICAHDRDTKRVAGVNLIVGKSTSHELRKLDVGSWLDKKWAGTRMPFISEVFATVPTGKKIYVEIKCGVEIIPKLLTEIEKSELDARQIVIICFDEKVVKSIKRAAPQFKAYWLSGFEKDLSGRLKPSLKKTLGVLRETNADGLSSTYKHISKSYIDSIVSSGYEYHVWTVDQVKTAQRFKSMGAKSITTNVPGVVGQALKRNRREN